MKKKIHTISARRKEDRDHKDDLSYLTIGYGSLMWSIEEVEDMLKKRAWQRRVGVSVITDRLCPKRETLRKQLLNDT